MFYRFLNKSEMYFLTSVFPLHQHSLTLFHSDPLTFDLPAVRPLFRARFRSNPLTKNDGWPLSTCLLEFIAHSASLKLCMSTYSLSSGERHSLLDQYPRWPCPCWFETENTPYFELALRVSCIVWRQKVQKSPHISQFFSKNQVM